MQICCKTIKLELMRIWLAGEDISVPQVARAPTDDLRSWAAKEAIYKACNCGRLQFPDLLVESSAGRPKLLPEPDAAGMMSAAGIKDVHLSISHDDQAGIAIAFATATSVLTV